MDKIYCVALAITMLLMASASADALSIGGGTAVNCYGTVLVDTARPMWLGPADSPQSVKIGLDKMVCPRHNFCWSEWRPNNSNSELDRKWNA